MSDKVAWTMRPLPISGRSRATERVDEDLTRLCVHACLQFLDRCVAANIQHASFDDYRGCPFTANPVRPHITLTRSNRAHLRMLLTSRIIRDGRMSAEPAVQGI